MKLKRDRVSAIKTFPTRRPVLQLICIQTQASTIPRPSSSSFHSSSSVRLPSASRGPAPQMTDHMPTLGSFHSHFVVGFIVVFGFMTLLTGDLFPRLCSS